MYSENNIIDSFKINFAESFSHYTKAKGTVGSGEAKLYMKGISSAHEIKVFFSNFRDDNQYFFSRENLSGYINNAAYEYLHQTLVMNNVRGYRNNIFEKYNKFKQKILSISPKWEITKENFDIVTQSNDRHYIRPNNLSYCNCAKQDITDHPWNFMRDILLPKITKIKIDKVRHFGAENYAFYFLLLLDLEQKNLIYHNSPELIESTLKEIEQSFTGTVKKYYIDARIGQGFFRDKVLSRMNKCQITGFSDPKFLEAAHIKPWTKADGEEKIDGFNGILLTPNCHKLFDRGMISFDDEGKLLKSSGMNSLEYEKLFKEDPNIGRSAIKNNKTKIYLEWHRNFVFEKFNNFEF